MEDDKLLYRQFLEGDISAFEELVIRYKDGLIYFIHRYVGDIESCEDIAQEVFAYLFVYKERYGFRSGLKTYLYAIAKNKAADHIRKIRRNTPIEEYQETTEDEELFQRVVKKEEQRLVQNCLKRLKPDYQAAIQLVDFEGMSYQDSAKALHKTLPQFRILVYRARKALGVLLQKEGYTNEE